MTALQMVVSRACACCLLTLAAHSASAADDIPGVDSLIAALSSPPPGPVARSLRFTSTDAPDPATHLCASHRRTNHADARNLVVVGYDPAAPGIDLDLHFVTGSDRLRERDRRLLDQLAMAMASDSLSNARFAIAGHTDATGSDSINQPLSCARAIAAREYLIDRGIAAGRLSAYGFGSARPVDRSRLDAAENRRVEIRREQY